MRQDPPRVSIIIPNYNHARYLGDAIGSVLNQTCGDHEIIVVDDGSTDNSREIIAPFGERVRAILQENRGLSAARNTGIRAARGSLIGVLDADDMLEPAYIETLTAELEKHPEADGIYCGYRFVDHRNSPLPQIEARDIAPAKLYQALLDGNFLVPEAVLVRKSCYDRSGLFDEALRACEDWDMWLRITGRSRIIYSREILTRHRILAGSMSTDPERMISSRFAVLRKQLGAEPVPGSTGQTRIRRAYARAWLTAMVENLQSGRLEMARTSLRKGASICPGILVEVDTYYQLGAWDQPKGSLGDLGSVNIRANTPLLIGMMQSLFENPDESPTLRMIKRKAFFTAYSTLAQLAYGAGDLEHARLCLGQAAHYSPLSGLSRAFLSLGLRSLLGPRVVKRLGKIQNGHALSPRRDR